MTLLPGKWGLRDSGHPQGAAAALLRSPQHEPPQDETPHRRCPPFPRPGSARRAAWCADTNIEYLWTRMSHAVNESRLQAELVRKNLAKIRE